MLLVDFKRERPDLVVKVGTENGAGYVYTGVLKDFDLRSTNDALEDGVWRAFAARCALFKRYQAVKDPHTTRSIECLLELRDAVENFRPLWEREIVEMARSAAEKDVVILIIQGAENGRLWLVNEELQDLQINLEQGVTRLLGAIYRDICDQLVNEYILILLKRGDVAAARKLEDEIMSDVYGAFKDPSALIKMARKIAVEKECYKGGRLVKPIKKMSEVLKKRMER